MTTRPDTKDSCVVVHAAAFRKSTRLVEFTAFTLMGKPPSIGDEFTIVIQWHGYECEVGLYRVRDRVSMAEKSIAAHHLPLGSHALHG
jgi:hypothetical protein